MVSTGFATYFVLKALNDKVVFFYSPSELELSKISGKETIRIGGIVLKDSVKFFKNAMHVSFVITDNKKNITVNYEGILPDLFREGQGVVVEGMIKEKESVFLAKRVLAKHDENYMPPALKKALE